jgi:hypothetical protein
MSEITEGDDDASDQASSAKETNPVADASNEEAVGHWAGYWAGPVVEEPADEPLAYSSSGALPEVSVEEQEEHGYRAVAEHDALAHELRVETGFQDGDLFQELEGTEEDQQMESAAGNGDPVTEVHGKGPADRRFGWDEFASLPRGTIVHIDDRTSFPMEIN